MEALISLHLLDSSYEEIAKLGEGLPSSDSLIKALGVEDNELYKNIVKFFLEDAVSKIKPLPTRSRTRHNRLRTGNVIAYSQSRKCLYLALHRLKLKLLIIKDIIDVFQKNDYNLACFEDGNKKTFPSFLSVLGTLYHRKNRKNLELMFPKSRAPERVKKLLHKSDTMTADKLLKLITSKKFSEKTNIIKFIMREIKASLFVCKVMLSKMDINAPFSYTKNAMIDAEKVMISNDFIPELIPAISKSATYNNSHLIDDCINGFTFLMDQVLEGINKAFEIASRGQIELKKTELPYYDGDIFQNQ
jgi:hypothetical protein